MFKKKKNNKKLDNFHTSLNLLNKTKNLKQTFKKKRLYLKNKVIFSLLNVFKLIKTNYSERKFFKYYVCIDNKLLKKKTKTTS